MTKLEEAVQEDRLDGAGSVSFGFVGTGFLGFSFVGFGLVGASPVRAGPVGACGAAHLAPAHLEILLVRAARRADGGASNVRPQRAAAARAARRVPAGF